MTSPEELRQAWLHILPPESVVDIHADPFDVEGGGSPHAA
jgi:hypothetical protein